MSNLINVKKEDLIEGVLLNRFLKNRLIKRNQNVLIAVTGTTGSGKSYACLRIAELWYKEQFNTEFPSTHICFCVEEVMKLLTSGKMRKGDLIILEEAGVNLGSLDFHNKISKLFGYVLQSFRSMNVGLIMNLPVLTMLNKSARLLIHCHMITSGIDYKNNMCKIKPFFHQLNQQSGKVYPKYMRAKVGNKTRKVQRFVYSLADDKLRKSYEAKKFKFITDFNEGFVQQLEQERNKEAIKMARDDFPNQKDYREILEWKLQGYSNQEIAKFQQCSNENIRRKVNWLDKKGYLPKKDAKKIRIMNNLPPNTKISKIPKENQYLPLVNVI